MLTRIEIDGFRNFVDFTVDLGPLQVLAGPNASGKSNFFDALHLLSRLVTRDSLSEAFSEVRGEPLRQFTRLPGGRPAAEMRFALEAIVPRRIRDPWGEEADLTRSHLRYELALALREDTGQPLIHIARESLSSFRKGESRERLAFPRSQEFDGTFLWWGNRATGFISTEGDRVVLHQDGRAGRKREHNRADLQGTVLSAVNSVTFRHAYAMREVLGNLHFLQLEPEELREPSPMTVFAGDSGRRLGLHGANLPAVLARLEAEDARLLAHITKDLRSVVADVKTVSVGEDAVKKQWIAQVDFAYGGPFPASLMSDGTLRVLALAALKNDTCHTGVLCFEEPENGIHPQKMHGLFRVLRGLATKTSSEPEGAAVGTHQGGSLRQLLVNTHSPALVSIVPREALLFATVRRVLHAGAAEPVLAATFLPVRDELPLRQEGEPPRHVTRAEVERLLSSVERPAWLSRDEAPR